MAEGTADSMSILAIVLSIVFCGAIYIFFTSPINGLIDTMNYMITGGYVTEDTFNYFMKCIDLWNAMPFFLIVGLSLFCLERSKGTEISIQTYFSYVFLMVVGIIISALLILIFGSLVDSVLIGMPSEQLHNIPEDWDISNINNYLVSMVYLLCLIPGYFSTILYMFHPVIKQRARGPTSESYEEIYSLEQF